ncbi:MAG: ELM1/GtrOC1 family putative glycosyltransferase [Pseudomonadales bacterium]
MVWILAGPKAGDNAQLRTLATALAEGVEIRVLEKPLRFRAFELLLHLPSRPTRAALTRATRAGLVPPWPDLVLTAGRRNELVARWVRNASGGRTRIVQLGRPWSRPTRFDLVVSTPQYQVPAAANVLTIPLPLQADIQPRLAQAARQWQARLIGLQTPRVALLLGGDSGPFVFTPALAERMAQQLNDFVATLGGSLMITTSPRTPEAFTRRLRELLTVPVCTFEWRSDASENPYWGFLALAEQIVVTAESVSMISEALATGKPTYLAPVTQPGTRPWWLRASSYRWKPLTHRLAMAVAPRRFRRDIGRIHAALVADGRVAWLGDGPPHTGTVEDASLHEVVQRVRQLLPSRRG